MKFQFTKEKNKKLTFFCLYKCKYIPSAHSNLLRFLSLTSFSGQVMALEQQTHKESSWGKWVTESWLQTGGWGYDGQRRNICWHWELNPSYRWQVSVLVESLRSMALDPLKYQECRHPPRLHISPQSGLIAALPLSSMGKWLLLVPHL